VTNGGLGVTHDDGLFDESWLDSVYFAFGQLRQAIWIVDPDMKYVMLQYASKNDLDNCS